MPNSVEKLKPRSRPLINPLPSLPPLLSFFSGAGFLDLGMINAGFKIVWSQEIDARISEVHDFGMTSFFKIEKYTSKPPLITSQESIDSKQSGRIRKEAFGTLSHGDHFGIVGGPPCPDFSIGGKNRGGEAERGRLTRIFVERICELNPSFFLLENVKGLVNTRKHCEFLFQQIANLEENGYAVDFALLNALDSGVAQDRERLFVVGVRRGLVRKMYARNLHKGERAWFPWPRNEKYYGAKFKYHWPTKIPFGSTPPEPSGIPPELFVGSLIIDQEEMRRLPNGTEAFNPYSKKFYEILEGDVSRKSFKRLHRFRYSPTVAYGNNEVHLHPVLPRRLTVREAMRIQSVPDSFILPKDMPLSLKFKIVGNGVPVRLAQEVGLAIRRFITGETC
ncbi:MAG: DNA cytosine methyltransferase [Dehalococcoidales bacterium]|nr:DNA cytosine methyltransferase [Dehalococcoidales bacterium]